VPRPLLLLKPLGRPFVAAPADAADDRALGAEFLAVAAVYAVGGLVREAPALRHGEAIHRAGSGARATPRTFVPIHEGDKGSPFRAEKLPYALSANYGLLIAVALRANAWISHGFNGSAPQDATR